MKLNINYNTDKDRNILIVFYDMIADLINKNKLNIVPNLKILMEQNINHDFT